MIPYGSAIKQKKDFKKSTPLTGRGSFKLSKKYLRTHRQLDEHAMEGKQRVDGLVCSALLITTE